jgi:hypothetical protein
VWTAEGDQLLKEGLGTDWVSFGDNDWTDFDLTFEARKRAGPGGFGASFRMGSGKQIWLSLGDNNKHRLGLLSPGKRSEIQSSLGTIRPLAWYKVTISLRVPRIRIELDDHLLFALTDEFRQKGRVELKCSDSAGAFRNIKLSAPDSTVLWDGPPELLEK